MQKNSSIKSTYFHPLKIKMYYTLLYFNIIKFLMYIFLFLVLNIINICNFEPLLYKKQNKEFGKSLKLKKINIFKTKQHFIFQNLIINNKFVKIMSYM